MSNYCGRCREESPCRCVNNASRWKSKEQDEDELYDLIDEVMRNREDFDSDLFYQGPPTRVC